jgi:hypothetical protein
MAKNNTEGTKKKSVFQAVDRYPFVVLPQNIERRRTATCEPYELNLQDA